MYDAKIKPTCTFPISEKPSIGLIALERVLPSVALGQLRKLCARDTDERSLI